MAEPWGLHNPTPRSFPFISPLSEISKELDFPVGLGQGTKQTGYLC